MIPFNLTFNYIRSIQELLAMTKYKSLSDQALIDLLNKDDEVAYEELYTRHWPSLYQSAYNILRDKSGCMDVLQEVFIWVWSIRVT